MKMKAYVLHDINDFRLEEVKKPVLQKETVLVEVKAAGICGSDIPRIFRTGTYSYPLIPGHEFSGVVSDIGEGVDPALLGKRVGVFPLIPCENCEPCRHKQYELCRNYSYLGSRADGGFARFVRVPIWNLISLPNEVGFEQAAMLEPMAVAVHAMHRAKVSEDSTVAICGLGTIGLLLAMFLLERGIKNIYVIGNKEFQRKKVLEIGIRENFYCDARTRDVEKWLEEKEITKGIDVFFDCVGRNEVVSQAIRHTSPNGTVVLVGNPASDMELDKSSYWKILRNQLTLVGTWNSSFTHEETDDWHYVLERLKAGKIHPEKLITHRMAFDELDKGFRVMRNKSEDYVKVMGVVEG